MPKNFSPAALLLSEFFDRPCEPGPLDLAPSFILVLFQRLKQNFGLYVQIRVIDEVSDHPIGSILDLRCALLWEQLLERFPVVPVTQQTPSQLLNSLARPLRRLA